MEKVKSLMHFYKTVYGMVAACVAMLGMVFFDFIINSSIPMPEIRV